jgi:TolA-binding protein
VKNLNTVERSQRIRLGKVVPDDQAAGTIILNATDDAIAAPVSGLYVSPIRFNDTYRANTLVYNTATGEISDSGHPAHQFQDLQNVTSLGATSYLRIDVSNTVTATQLGVGNTTPQHTLSVSGNTWISGDLTVVGDTTFVQSKNLQISDPLVELGGNNSTEQYVFDVGLLYNRPDPKSVGVVYLEGQDELAIAYTLNTASDRYVTPDAANTLAVQVYGDVTANAFFGEGQYLQNVAVLSNFDSNVERVVNLESNLLANSVRVTNLEDQLLSNHIRTSNLETYATSNNIRVSTLELGQIQNATRLTTLYAYHASNVLRIEDLESNLVQNSNRIFTLSDELADNSARISVLSTRLQDNSFRISVNTTNLLSNHFRVTNLESNLVANAARVTSLEGRASALETQTSNLETNLGSNVIRVQTLESRADDLRTDMDSNSALLFNTVEELDSNAARILVLEAQGLQEVVDIGNTVSNTVIFTNTTTSLVTDGTVGVNTREPDTNYELHVAGNVLVQSNVEAELFKAPGTELNVNGRNKLTGNTTIYGNLNVFGNVTYLDTENVYVKDPILGIGNPGASDSGVIAMSASSHTPTTAHSG